MSVLQQEGNANIKFTLICGNQHTEIWHTSDTLPDSKKLVRQTPLQHMMGAILAGMNQSLY
jgi:hypothetical protein